MQSYKSCQKTGYADKKDIRCKSRFEKRGAEYCIVTTSYLSHSVNSPICAFYCMLNYGSHSLLLYIFLPLHDLPWISHYFSPYCLMFHVCCGTCNTCAVTLFPKTQCSIMSLSSQNEQPSLSLLEFKREFRIGFDNALYRCRNVIF